MKETQWLDRSTKVPEIGAPFPAYRSYHAPSTVKNNVPMDNLKRN